MLKANQVIKLRDILLTSRIECIADSAEDIAENGYWNLGLKDLSHKEMVEEYADLVEDSDSEEELKFLAELRAEIASHAMIVNPIPE